MGKLGTIENVIQFFANSTILGQKKAIITMAFLFLTLFCYNEAG